jgi:hypothetical protein
VEDDTVEDDDAEKEVGDDVEDDNVEDDDEKDNNLDVAEDELEVDDVEDDENQEEEEEDYDVEDENVEEGDERRIVFMLWTIRYIEDDEVKGEENNDIENDMVRRRKIVIDIILITWSLNLINDFYLHTNFSI